MKTNKFLLTIFITGSINITSKICLAQAPTTYNISNVVTNMPTESVPFEARKSGVNFFSTYSYTIDNRNNAIPDKLYDNVQLTQYTNAAIDPELWGISFRKFAISGSNNVLLVVSFGGATDWRTDVMCVVNASGQILSTLEVAVCVIDTYVKQFRVTAQGQVIVTSIKPTSTTSIPFETFRYFVGYRQDITYSINAQGQFVQNLVQTYQPKVYTRLYLRDEDINLWEGGETLQ